MKKQIMSTSYFTNWVRVQVVLSQSQYGSLLSYKNQALAFGSVHSYINTQRSVTHLGLDPGEGTSDHSKRFETRFNDHTRSMRSKTVDVPSGSRSQYTDFYSKRTEDYHVFGEDSSEFLEAQQPFSQDHKPKRELKLDRQYIVIK